jgi:putative transposase
MCISNNVNIVYKFRIKNNEKILNRWAKTTNFVWNYCNETQKFAVKRDSRFFNGFDLVNLVSGSSKELEISSEAINAICLQYAKSRRQHKRPWLRFRGKKNLGWIPLKGRSIKFDGKCFTFFGKTFKVFLSRHIPADTKFKDNSSFSQDSKGNWYLNLCLEIPENKRKEKNNAIGIDLGLKDFAALSNGEKIEAPKIFRKTEDKLAKAQRANKKKLVTNLHTKIKNQRKDFQHKLSTRIVREFYHIAVGDVNSSKLAKTNMAKSVFDAGWSQFRNMLAYKSVREGAKYFEVSEYLTTQTCAVCGCIAGPKGQAGLNKREWDCECGSVNDRDQNSALLILFRSGHRTPAQGIPFL